MKFDWKPLLALAAWIAVCIAGRAGAQNSSQDDAFRQLFNQGQAAKAGGRFVEAIGDFEHLEKMDASVAEVHAILGVLYFQQGNFVGAVAEIREARRLKPSLPGLDGLLSFSLAEAGHEREALSGLEKAFHASEDEAVKRQAGLELMRAYSHLDMDRKAVETALQMRDLYRNDSEVLYNVGKILGNSAYVTMQALFKDAGTSLWAQLAEAEAQESQGQTEQAIASYRHVLQIDSRRPNIHYRIGRTYLARWKTTHAESDLSSASDEFRKELDVNPSNGNAAYELAVMDASQGKLDEARVRYQQVLARYPEFEEAIVGLAGVVIADGQKPAEAVALLERATKLRPGDEVAWYRLAQADRASGDKAGQATAQAEFQKLHNSTHAKLRPPNADSEVTPQTLGENSSPEP